MPIWKHLTQLLFTHTQLGSKSFTVLEVKRNSSTNDAAETLNSFNVKYISHSLFSSLAFFSPRSSVFLFSLSLCFVSFFSLFPVLSFSKCMIAVDPCWKVTLPTMPCWEHSGSDNSHAVSKQSLCVRAREEDIGHFRRLWMIICLTTVGYKS